MVDIPSKKIKGDGRFMHYYCTCSALGDSTVPLLITQPDRLSCILSNFKIYLMYRRLWDGLSKEYRNEIERNIQLPNTRVEKIILAKMPENGVKYKGVFGKTFKLYMLEEVDVSCFMLPYIQYLCCQEFVEFVNKHIHNDDFENEIKKANEFIEMITTTNMF
nr:hypothetical protein MmNV_12 [Menippe mercenaria nudivirus]